jgi:hypothetical protein
LHGELETSEEEKKLFKLEKKRNKSIKDLKQMKNEQGYVLTNMRLQTDGNNILRNF